MLRRRRNEIVTPSRPAKRHQTIKFDGDAVPTWDSRAPFGESNASVPEPPSRSTSVLNESALLAIPEVEDEIEIDDEQQRLVDLITTGQNVFYTGSAGCGKSTVLKAFVARLRNMGRRVSVTAPTGRAALDINGCTTWTFAGWTPDSMKKSMVALRNEVEGRHICKRLQDLDVLVIDEISMVENHFFERLNQIMQQARNNGRAFGGVQLIVAGDFCQLPPVKPFRCCMECGYEMRTLLPNTTYECIRHGQFDDSEKWAFRSNAWDDAQFAHFYLRTIYRQTDQQLINMLEKLRLGKDLTHNERDLLENHPCDVEGAAKLCSTKEQVRDINSREFQRLRGRRYTYRCLDHWKWNRDHEHLRYKNSRSRDGSLLALQEHAYDDFLQLKEGMRVALLMNIDIKKGLVNGSQGTVVGFWAHREGELPRARTRYDEGNYETDDRRERLATDHVHSLGGDHVYLRQEQIKLFMADERNQDKYLPIVEFDNGRRATIYPNCNVSSLGDTEPYSLLARTQIPLTAAWAMTIHKSQGMTLEKVIVDVSNIFEEGQLYVALSRAKSLHGLRIEGFDSGYEGGSANNEMVEFYRQKFGIH